MEARGFFSSLFDYSFGSFLTPKIIKILYVLATVVISLWTLVLLLYGFNVSSLVGVVTLVVVCPLFFLWSMIWTRVLLELIMVLFRINSNVQDIHDGRSGSAAAPMPAPEAPSAGAPVLAPTESRAETRQEPAAPAATAEQVSEAAPTASSPPAAEPAPVRYCENCGAERSPTARFCTNCGHE